MLELLHVLLSVLAGVDIVAAGAAAPAIALLVAAALVILAVVAVAQTGPVGTAPHPQRAIAFAIPQSDPDAAGRPRPRAPQSAASAA